MDKIVIALLFSVALSTVGLGFYNTYRLGATSEKKTQAEREANVASKQRDIATRPGITRNELLDLMFHSKF